MVRTLGADGFNQCFRIHAFGARARQEDSYSNTACLEIKNVPTVANVVTPNQDGKNDAIILDYLNLYPNHEVRVYNRYGVPQGTFKPYLNNWPADNLPSGLYFLLIDLGNGSASTKQWVQVVK